MPVPPIIYLSRRVRTERRGRRRRGNEQVPYNGWQSGAVFGQVLSFIANLITQGSSSKYPLGTHPFSMALSILALLVMFFASLVLLIHPNLNMRTKRAFTYISILSGSLGLSLAVTIALYYKFGWVSYLLCLVLAVIILLSPLTLMFWSLCKRLEQAVTRPSQSDMAGQRVPV